MGRAYLHDLSLHVLPAPSSKITHVRQRLETRYSIRFVDGYDNTFLEIHTFLTEAFKR